MRNSGTNYWFIMLYRFFQCLVMCFRLNFAKDPIVINTASATVRQMVNCVYERVIQVTSV